MPPRPGRLWSAARPRAISEPSGDRDWFAVTLEAGKLYRFDLMGWSTGDGTLGAPYLRGIYDANGDQHEGTTDWGGGEGSNSRVYFRPDGGATYYVSAGGYGDDDGTYTLAVSDATDDYADDSTTTGTVVVGGSATGTIEYNGDTRLVCGDPWRRARSIGSTWRRGGPAAAARCATRICAASTMPTAN